MWEKYTQRLSEKSNYKKYIITDDIVRVNR